MGAALLSHAPPAHRLLPFQSDRYIRNAASTLLSATKKPGIILAVFAVG